MGLGDLTGGDFWSQAYDVSYDGTVVVGKSSSSLGGEIYRWSLQGGIEGLGHINETAIPSVSVSNDGSIVAGMDKISGAFRWSAETGAITDIIGGSGGVDVSGDGTTVVGHASFPGDGADARAYRWTEQSGKINLGVLPDGSGTKISVARGVSEDGSVVVGSSRVGGSFRNAFRWTTETGMVSLGDLPGGEHYGTADSVSADGSVIVGWGTTEFGPEAYRWTEQTGMVGLGDLSGGIFSSGAADVSADGSIVVGVSESSLGLEPFIWDEQDGMRSILGLLESKGVDLSEWTLSKVTAISGDGSTIVGYGINPDGFTESWIANISAIPIPPALWLFGSGLLGLIGIARRRSNKI